MQVGDKIEKTIEHSDGHRWSHHTPRGSGCGGCSLSGLHPKINGDKIGERLALADEAGIEPALTMYSRPAFANLECAGKAKRRRRFRLPARGVSCTQPKRCRAALATALPISFVTTLPTRSDRSSGQRSVHLARIP